jgi:hypothetical protein
MAAQISAALDACDVDAVTSGRTRIAAVEEITSVLTGQRARAQSRSDQIGDGTADFVGELSAALGAEQAALAEVRKIENILDPESPQAIRDAAIEELKATLAAQRDRIGEERRAALQHRATIFRS